MFTCAGEVDIDAVFAEYGADLVPLEGLLPGSPSGEG
jgi:hypothetical protein